MHTKAGMNLKCIIQSKRSHTQKAILSDSICMNGKGKTLAMKNR